ncbi:hypothetical protein KFE94_07010 [bacterium SCSIO 12643]|nr:hypothetical protein KFE94_07010 [bacterium SCSIO 12643]
MVFNRIKNVGLLVWILFVSCAIQKNSITKNKCDDVLRILVEEHWEYNEEYKVVKADSFNMSFFMGNMFEKDCLSGKNKKEVKKLFGTPNKVSDNKFWYYINPTCHSVDSINCVYFYFDFDENGIYKTNGIRGWSKSN